MKTEHTKTPWSVSEFKNGFKLEIVADDGTVCTVAGTSGTESETKANAALIVRACNSHEELVAALRDVMSDPYFKKSSTRYTHARAALQKAGAL